MIKTIFSYTMKYDVPEPWDIFFQDKTISYINDLKEFNSNIMYYLTIVLFSLILIMIILLLAKDIYGYPADRRPRYASDIIEKKRLLMDTDYLAIHLRANIGRTFGEIGFNFSSPRNYNNITAKFLRDNHDLRTPYIFGVHPNTATINNEMIIRVRSFHLNVPVSYRTTINRRIDSRR
jgi:hypothetical protein